MHQGRLAVAAYLLCGCAAVMAPLGRASAQGKSEGEPGAPATKETKAGAAKQDAKAAEEPDDPLLKSYSPYERTTIRGALKKLEAEIDPAPEGKVVEKVDVITLDVIEKRDPAPGFLNWFHATSKRDVIEREILIHTGDRYQQRLADETARNLRSVRQISLVLCIPLKGSSEDRVRIVVITKDIWSLRLNTNFHYAGGRFEYLLIQPSEENLLGTHHSISATFLLNLASYSLGLRYSMPRIGGSQIRLLADASVIVNRESGEAEGSFGSFSYGQPLFSTQAKWAWGVSMTWRKEVTRRFCVTGSSACTGDLRGYDAEVTPQDDAIPYAYRSDIVTGQYYATRSFGSVIKHDFSAGLDVSRRVFRPLDLSTFELAAAEEFVMNALPVSDTRIGPFLEYRTASTRFHRVLDLETLGLQEDVRIGHEVILKVSPITTALNASRNFFATFAGAKYGIPLGDGLAAAFVESTVDIEADRLADASIEAGARVITPRIGIGRLLVDARMLHRYRNYLNRTSALGGSTRLRGYPTQAFLGKDVVVANFEFRTRPVEILACQLGAAAFFDAGDAFEGWSDFRPKQSAGFGLRILFPQLDRTVLRADWGFPLTRGYREPDALPGDIVVTFKQAFPIPDVPSRGSSIE
jgi:hypothetical protein